MAKPRLLIERAIAKQRASLQESMALGRVAPSLITMQGMLALVCLERAECSLWEPSGMALVAAERTEIDVTGEYDAVLPMGNLWIQTTVPIVAPVGEVTVLFMSYMSDTSAIVEVARRLSTSKRAVQDLEAALAESAATDPEAAWILYAMDSRLSLLWQFGFKADPRKGTATWQVPETYVCSFGECRPEQPLCPHCHETLTFLSSWFFCAFRVLSGEYQETDVAPFAEVSEAHVRKVPRQDKPHKLRKTTVTRSYRLIQFDASVVRLTPRRPVENARGSWIARDPDAVQRYEREVPKRTRVLRHPRYAAFIEAHGGTLETGAEVPVRAHHKQVPYKHSRPRPVLHVTASDYEAGSDKEEYGYGTP